MTNLPYPAGSLKMADADVHMKKLAESVQFGSGTSASLATGTQALVNVAFPLPYATAPTVLACMAQAGINPSLYQVSVESVTTTGCVIRCRNGTAGASAVAFNWVALGTRA